MIGGVAGTALIIGERRSQPIGYIRLEVRYFPRAKRLHHYSAEVMLPRPTFDPVARQRHVFRVDYYLIAQGSNQKTARHISVE